MSSSSLYSKDKNVMEEGRIDSELRFWVFRVRVSDFSLSFRVIRLLDFFGARSKVVLRSDGFTWVPVLRSLDNLREIGVLSYLFYPLFKCFVDDLVGLRS